MKLIMENWRKYLKEGNEVNLKNLALYVEKDDEGEYNIRLFDWPKDRRSPIPIGALGTMSVAQFPDGPCIPTTKEIGTSAVHRNYEGKGIGTYMYEVISLFMKMDADGGITSDHSASTTRPAAAVWSKLANRLGYVKRKTDAGNDTFDYDRETPDPDDNCYKPSAGTAAMDHSLQIPPERVPIIGNIMSVQLGNWEKISDKLEPAELKALLDKAGGLFSSVYDPYSSGIHGEDESKPKKAWGEDDDDDEIPIFENWKNRK